MLLAQMTDFHVSRADAPIEAEFHTSQRLAAAVAHLEKLDPAPDVVLGTGDLVDCGSPEEYARLLALLAPLSAPLFVVPGNHDAREPLREAFAARGYLPEAGCLRYVIELDGLRLIALDTLVAGQPGGRIGTEQLQWLDTQLGEHPARPTIIMQHHPPIVTGIAAMDAMGLEDADAEAEVLARHPQIERVLCGHLHRPIVARVGGTVASTCPSTAHQVALDLRPAAKIRIVADPPAVQLHTWQNERLVSHTSYVLA